MSNSRKTTSADRMFMTLCVVIIAVVLGLGGYAVYGKISKNLQTKAIEENNAEKTVSYLADQAGMSVDEYLAEYGLSGTEGIDGKTTESEMVSKMTIGNLAKYEGTDLDAFIEENGLPSDKVDENTPWEEAKDLIPLDTYFGGQFEEVKAAYELDDSITGDMTWGETKDVILAAQEAYIEKLQNATPAPETEADTDAEAEADADAVAEAEAEADTAAEPEAEAEPAADNE